MKSGYQHIHRATNHSLRPGTWDLELCLARTNGGWLRPVVRIPAAAFHASRQRLDLQNPLAIEAGSFQTGLNSKPFIHQTVSTRWKFGSIGLTCLLHQILDMLLLILERSDLVTVLWRLNTFQPISAFENLQQISQCLILQVCIISWIWFLSFNPVDFV